MGPLGFINPKGLLFYNDFLCKTVLYVFGQSLFPFFSSLESTISLRFIVVLRGGLNGCVQKLNTSSIRPKRLSSNLNSNRQWIFPLHRCRKRKRLKLQRRL